MRLAAEPPQHVAVASGLVGRELEHASLRGDGLGCEGLGELHCVVEIRKVFRVPERQQEECFFHGSESDE